MISLLSSAGRQEEPEGLGESVEGLREPYEREGFGVGKVACEC